MQNTIPAATWIGRDPAYLVRLAAAVASALLLAAAYPPLEWSELAWLAWVPLLCAGFSRPPGEAFQLFWLAGWIFWGLNIFWLTEVTWFGWLLLSMYCAIYTGSFGAVVALVRRRFTAHVSVFLHLGLMLALPMIWTGFEYLRAVLFTGFAWNPLGGSQFERIALIQLAQWTGVYGLSALVMGVNCAVALTVERYRLEGWRGGRAWHPELMAAFLVLALVVSVGTRSRQRALAHPSVPLRVALIQPDVPQYEKWSPEFVDMIYDRLEHLTTMAIDAGRPDLVIWPETAVPDYVRDSRRSYDLVQRLARRGAPILVGSMDIAWEDGGVPRYFNSAILFDAAGLLVEAYDKQHLVMFGEYVPLQRFLPFLRAMTPIEASFDAGNVSTIFEMEEPPVPFSVLICFEDTVSHLARRAVRNGARLLVNQTNDAWFRKSSAARQHMTHSVLRAVENGVPVVRAANTGVSCGVDRQGRVHDVLADDTGNTFVKGFRIVELEVPSQDQPLTFYTRAGDWFAWAGLVALGMAIGPSLKRRIIACIRHPLPREAA